MGGGDKLFHKRKARKLSEHGRRKAKRDPYDMVLIVCEGKTEESYFKGLIRDLKLNTANVQVPHNTAGSSPRNVVDFGLEEYNRTKEYDNVYCVFDKDKHSTYKETLDRVKRKKLRKDHSIHAITSVPCFEFWILLHYKETTKKFYSGQGSPCALVVRDLKEYIPNYEKGGKVSYASLKGELNKAINNAKKVAACCKASGTDDPSTQIHELILYLHQLKK
jgi:hypothetical protein